MFSPLICCVFHILLLQSNAPTINEEKLFRDHSNSCNDFSSNDFHVASLRPVGPLFTVLMRMESFGRIQI